MGFFDELGKFTKAVKDELDKDKPEIRKYYSEGKEMEYTELVKAWESASSDSAKEGYGDIIKQRVIKDSMHMEYDKLITLYKNSQISAEKDGYATVIKRHINAKVRKMQNYKGFEESYNELKKLHSNSTITLEEKIYEDIIRKKLKQAMQDGTLSDRNVLDLYGSWGLLDCEIELCRKFLCKNGYLNKKRHYERTDKQPPW